MLKNKVGTVTNTNRSFLNPDLIWGVKQQDLNSVVTGTVLHNKVYDPAGFIGRRLSEIPSTYLR